MIQIDMEMPATCYDCPFCHDCCSCCLVENSEFDFEICDEQRMPYCPLYEVQNDDCWISMETPPKEDGKYITKTNAYGKSKGVISQDYVTRTVRGKQIRRWEWNNRVSPWITTHWMPLPEPPKEEY